MSTKSYSEFEDAKHPFQNWTRNAFISSAIGAFVITGALGGLTHFVGNQPQASAPSAPTPITAPSAPTPITPTPQPDSADRTPTNPIKMADYVEVRKPLEVTDELRLRQSTYLAQKDALTAKINQCLSGSQECDPNIQRFAQMLEGLRANSSTMSKLDQAMLVNTYINMSIAYDFSERDQNKPHRTLSNALIDSMGVCDEQASLKLYALEYIGFNHDDLRYIYLNSFVNAELQKTGHAFVLLRIDNTNWVLNNFQEPTNGLHTADIDVATALIYDDSELETPGKSLSYSEPGNYLLPIGGFNSTQRAYYNDPTITVLPQALVAQQALYDQTTPLYKTVEAAELVNGSTPFSKLIAPLMTDVYHVDFAKARELAQQKAQAQHATAEFKNQFPAPNNYHVTKQRFAYGIYSNIPSRPQNQLVMHSAEQDRCDKC